MNEKPPKKLKPGVFSRKELFYFFFALLAFGVLVLVYSAGRADGDDDARLRHDAKFARRREAARAIEIAGGCVISETQVLYHDLANHPANPWVLYDVEQDEMTDGGRLTRALARAETHQDALAQRGFLSGWKGDLVFTTFAVPGQTNTGSLIFEWGAGLDEVKVFKWLDFAGRSRRASALPMMAVENGWGRPYAYNELQSGRVRVAVVGNLGRPMPFVNQVFTNLGVLPVANSAPFLDELYITTTTPDRRHAGIYILSLTNRSLVFSNAAAGLPRACDRLAAFPDPAGGRVLWMLGTEPGLNTKLRAFLPAAIAPRAEAMTWHFYWSGLRATKFTSLCTSKNDLVPQFLWGVNGGSIWLLDAEEGIRRVELK